MHAKQAVQAALIQGMDKTPMDKTTADLTCVHYCRND